MRNLGSTLASTAFLSLALAGCASTTDDSGGSGPGDGGAAACNTDNEECAPDQCSGEGADMLPGSDCIACHSPGNFGEEEGVFFTAAGTLFTDFLGTEPVRGAKIKITDSNGGMVVIFTSTEGNFFTDQILVPPLDAEVEVDGIILTMGTAVATGACNSCHKCDGAAGGKLRAP